MHMSPCLDARSVVKSSPLFHVSGKRSFNSKIMHSRRMTISAVPMQKLDERGHLLQRRSLSPVSNIGDQLCMMRIGVRGRLNPSDAIRP